MGTDMSHHHPFLLCKFLKPMIMIWVMTCHIIVIYILLTYISSSFIFYLLNLPCKFTGNDMSYHHSLSTLKPPNSDSKVGDSGREPTNSKQSKKIPRFWHTYDISYSKFQDISYSGCNDIAYSKSQDVSGYL